MNMTDTSTYPVHLSVEFVMSKNDAIRAWLWENIGPSMKSWTVLPDTNIGKLNLIFLSESDRTRFILTWGVG